MEAGGIQHHGNTAKELRNRCEWYVFGSAHFVADGLQLFGQHLGLRFADAEAPHSVFRGIDRFMEANGRGTGALESLLNSSGELPDQTLVAHRLPRQRTS